MTVQVVLVHGIRTSATMWRAQLAHLAERGNPATAVELPGHGVRMAETFTLEGAFATIDAAVRDAAANGPVLLVGHSMGGLLSIASTSVGCSGGGCGTVSAADANGGGAGSARRKKRDRPVISVRRVRLAELIRWRRGASAPEPATRGRASQA